MMRVCQKPSVWKIQSSICWGSVKVTCVNFLVYSICGTAPLMLACLFGPQKSFRTLSSPSTCKHFSAAKMSLHCYFLITRYVPAVGTDNDVARAVPDGSLCVIKQKAGKQ